ncbi:Flavin monooxygenase-like protein [Metarhizium album ARSEF 1941]|uniref:Flavin monooxygenase-like protein n=1 Tax=Metarhizium album (strain ARSEF 1941) TaxID=1081103 RepID=A0A0B2WQR9_METAS|nr:Flavin monooxygenase-like protein [Metarhizium album ARSEF 1941]KHN95984.1 Flavin monooxygenase-like protein [Metarhizium album ARSEF 1941]
MSEIAERHDLVILGAGLSGINTAHILRQQLPRRRFTILEARSVIGGTWSFFKFPGFRSDSYMTTFGFRWHPWPHAHKIASAKEIAAYVEDAARQDGTYDQIRFNHRVIDAEWRDEDAFWRLTVEHDGEAKILAANFVIGCTGYYAYDRAMPAAIPGIESFAGTVAHPQWWPEHLDCSDKRVVLVGSGATAYTIAPALADKVARLTMVQRSPSYAAAIPTTSWLDTLLRTVLPASLAHNICWWKDMAYEIFITQFMVHFPRVAKFVLRLNAKSALPEDCDVDLHFSPRYEPLQQRLCLCPDGDFFQALHRPNVELVTDVIDRVLPDGVLLDSGRKLDADVIITATGLYFQIMSGIAAKVNGARIGPGSLYTWRGTMLESLPNMGYVLGYVLQSWTPGAEAIAKLLVRVIKAMEDKQATKVMPVLERRKGMPRRLAVDLNSNYFVKAADRIPKVTGEDPWYGRTHWIRDMWSVLFGDIDKALEFSGVEENKKGM